MKHLVERVGAHLQRVCGVVACPEQRHNAWRRPVPVFAVKKHFDLVVECTSFRIDLLRQRTVCTTAIITTVVLSRTPGQLMIFVREVNLWRALFGTTANIACVDDAAPAALVTLVRVRTGRTVATAKHCYGRTTLYHNDQGPDEEQNGSAPPERTVIRVRGEKCKANTLVPIGGRFRQPRNSRTHGNLQHPPANPGSLVIVPFNLLPPPREHR
eukprot:SAG31_NODE_860_length_11431_cov_8.068920_5_plen_213_part_00